MLVSIRKNMALIPRKIKKKTQIKKRLRKKILNANFVKVTANLGSCITMLDLSIPKSFLKTKQIFLIVPSVKKNFLKKEVSLDFDC